MKKAGNDKKDEKVERKNVTTVRKQLKTKYLDKKS